MAVLRFAILGCGRMGRQHADRLARDGRAEVAALYDVDPGCAARLRDELAPRAVVCTDESQFWSLESIDAAVICTLTSSHYEHVLKCRERGWAILCEKPLADTRSRARHLIDAIESTPPAFSLAYQRRGWGAYAALRREVQSGRWGPIRAVSAHSCERWQQTISGTWRDDPVANPGGFVGDAGSHKLDAFFFVTGLTVAEVFARSWTCGANVNVTTHVSAVTTSDVPVVMDFVGNAHHQGEDLHIHCDDADLMLRDMRVWIARGNRIEPLTPVALDVHPVVMFLDHLLGQRENRAPIGCAWPVLELTEAILKSSECGHSVRAGDQNL